jgi:hypothetical protein
MEQLVDDDHFGLPRLPPRQLYELWTANVDYAGSDGSESDGVIAAALGRIAVVHEPECLQEIARRRHAEGVHDLAQQTTRLVREIRQHPPAVWTFQAADGTKNGPAHRAAGRRSH